MTLENVRALSCSSKMQRVMKLGLALDKSRKMAAADCSDVVTPHWFWSYSALKVDKIWET